MKTQWQVSGGLSTKIKALVDQDGLPLRIVLSAGQASDKAAVEALIDGLKPAQALVADRGYDARAVIDLVAARGGRAHIPTQKDRKVQRSVDPMLYRQRNLIERYFCKIKHFRRIATRFDKLARNFLAAVTLASARLWLRAYESRTYTRSFRSWARRPAVEPSRPSVAMLRPATSGSRFVASSLPSSTPHWSKALMPRIVAMTKTLCS